MRITALRPLALFLLLLLALAGSDGNVSASPGPGWYDDNWVYRKAITIDYAKVGLGDYEIVGTLQNLGEIDTSGWDGGVLQGVTTDGTYVYAIKSSSASSTVIKKLLENGDEAATATITARVPYSSDLTYHDNYLYIISVENYGAENTDYYWAAVYKYDTDLNYVENWDLQGETYGKHPEGICYYDNHWWINTYHAPPTMLFKLDNDWNGVENYSWAAAVHWQGGAFWEKYGHVFYAATSPYTDPATYDDRLHIFEYVDNSFVWKENVPLGSSGAFTEQGWDVENTDGFTAWFADRANRTLVKSNVENLIKLASDDNFPVLVSWGSDSDLATRALDNGDDIIFVDSDNIKLDHEIENFNGATGGLTAFFRVPALSNSENTTVYMYYGNPSATNQENPPGVWNDNFIGVWHMGDNNTSSILDSTSNNYDGTKKGANEPAETAGKFDNGQLYDANDDAIKTVAPLDAGVSFTLEGWFTTSSASDYQSFFSGDIPAGSYRWYIRTGPSGENIVVGASDGGWSSATYTQPNTSDGNWHLLTITFDGGTNVWRIYYEGEYTGTSLVKDYTTNTVLEMGEIHDTDVYGGVLDEVRLSNVIRSTNWIQTTFNNENDPSSFYSVGNEESENGATFYSTTSDGYIYNEAATYAAVHDNSVGYALTDGADYFYIGQVVISNYNIKRGFVFFDTSSVQDNAVITSATLSLYGRTDSSTDDFNIVIQNGQPTYPSDPLALGDYSYTHYGTTNGGSFNTAGFTTAGYNDIPLNDNGISWINKTGITKLALRSENDIDNVWPDNYEYVCVWSSDKGAEYRPRLVISFTTEPAWLGVENWTNYLNVGPPAWLGVENWINYLEVAPLAWFSVENWINYMTTYIDVEPTPPPPPDASDYVWWVIFVLRFFGVMAPLGLVAWKFTKIKDPITGFITVIWVGMGFIAIVLLWFVVDAIEAILAVV